MKKYIYFALCLIFTFILAACSREVPEGEILILAETLVVGEAIPIVLQVPPKFDDLHKEMWACELKEGDEFFYKLEYIKEEGALADSYEKGYVEALFKDSPVDIYREDYAMETLYSPRIVLFTPEQSGTYRISVDGYYHTTSPSNITSLEVTVDEASQ